MRLLPCEWTESLYGNTQPESVLTRITSHRNWSVLRKNLLKPIIPVKCDAFRCWQQFPCYTPSDIIKYNSFLVTPRIKRSTLVTLSVFPVVGTIVAERKKGIPEDLPQMGNLSESLVFKAFYALLILDPWHQYHRLHMGRDNALNIGSTGEQVIPPCMREHIHPGRNILLPFQLISKYSVNLIRKPFRNERTGFYMYFSVF